jgi:hypothetical protein
VIFNVFCLPSFFSIFFCFEPLFLWRRKGFICRDGFLLTGESGKIFGQFVRLEDRGSACKYCFGKICSNYARGLADY